MPFLVGRPGQADSSSARLTKCPRALAKFPAWRGSCRSHGARDRRRGRAAGVALVRRLRGDGMLTLALAIAITYLIAIVASRLFGLP